MSRPLFGRNFQGNATPAHAEPQGNAGPQPGSDGAGDVCGDYLERCLAGLTGGLAGAAGAFSGGALALFVVSTAAGAGFSALATWRRASRPPFSVRLLLKPRMADSTSCAQPASN